MSHYQSWNALSFSRSFGMCLAGIKIYAFHFTATVMHRFDHQHIRCIMKSTNNELSQRWEAPEKLNVNIFLLHLGQIHSQAFKMTAFPGCANLKESLWYSNGHAQQKVSDKALPCKHTLVVFWEDSHHNAPPTPFPWRMTSYHWNAGYRETRELPSPKTHTGRKRGEHKEGKKGLLTRTHTQTQQKQ